MITRTKRLARLRTARHRNEAQRYRRLLLEQLEDRRVLAMSVVAAVSDLSVDEGGSTILSGTITGSESVDAFRAGHRLGRSAESEQHADVQSGYDWAERRARRHQLGSDDSLLLAEPSVPG